MTETVVDGNKCRAWVKADTGEKKRCETNLPKGQPECRNKKSHMWKFKSGFCAIGWCEGTQPVDAAGKSVRTCKFWMQCNCDCHEKIDQMFSSTGMPRMEMPNPKYVHVKSEYWMPDRTLDMTVVNEDGQEITQAVTLLDAKRDKHFHETDTGKRARGQLEYEVLEVCKNFVKGVLETEVLTPAFIAQEIDEVEPPSVGAIGAVFDRWTKLGFAVCEKGPVRFTSFTVDGLQYGLDNLKARSKREQKSAVNQAARTLRPRR